LLQLAAICCNWLQLLQLAATAAIGCNCCNWLQLAASSCNWLQVAATGARGWDEIWADTQVSPTGYDGVQFAATGCNK
jgi:hypothetical protein